VSLAASASVAASAYAYLYAAASASALHCVQGGRMLASQAAVRLSKLTQQHGNFFLIGRRLLASFCGDAVDIANSMFSFVCVCVCSCVEEMK